jgi:D-alanyl-lipoteichoic acid acyltransferase DltB (MBOAT superfamily)
MSNSRSAPSSSDCLFFLFVNPTLTYSNRGVCHGPPGLKWRPIGRVALGTATMFVCSAVLRPAYRAMPEVVEPIHLLTHPVASLLIAGSLRLIIAYSVHSGLASIQIGFMNLLGHSVPERYNYPLLATSPLDFWRRWNTYVGSWLGKYVFVPLTRQLQPTLRTWSKGSALFLTFVASGVLHDGYTYATTLTISTKFLQLFATSGITVLVWLALSSARAKTSLSARHLWQTFARPMPRFATLLLLVLAAARWG